MNFTKPYQHDKVIQNGDLIIIYERHDSLDHTYVKKNEIFQNKFGAFYFDDMIGKPFGSKIESRSSTGYIYVLEPSPELWSTALNTRTQIVDESDSGFVASQLDLFPGCRVVESGTGSGNMTLSLARAVGPSGHVYTFEYNGVRAATAKTEFERLGVSSCVTCTHRDVCGKVDAAGGGGFGSVVEPHTIDAVFLDLPEPWLALEHAVHVMKEGANICVYSPCAEQVSKCNEQMRAMGFQFVHTFELRRRQFDARVVEMDTINLGTVRAPTKGSGDDDEEAVFKYNPPAYISNTEKRRLEEVGLTGEIALDNTNGAATASLVMAAAGRQSAVAAVEDGSSSSSHTKEDQQPQKKQCTGNVKDGSPVVAGDDWASSEAYQQALQMRIKNRPQSAVNGSHTAHVARPIASMKGHTAFLTFASGPLLPYLAAAVAAAGATGAASNTNSHSADPAVDPAAVSAASSDV